MTNDDLEQFRRTVRNYAAQDDFASQLALQSLHAWVFKSSDPEAYAAAFYAELHQGDEPAPNLTQARHAWVWSEEREKRVPKPAIGSAVAWERRGNRAFMTWLRGLQAAAWEEGRTAGRSDTHDRPAPNPYQQEGKTAGGA